MTKNSSEKTYADLVVYGKIFTSEDNQIVEAFAVKDGKYVYVGDKKGAEAFLFIKTESKYNNINSFEQLKI
jgi:predicted amidohydrolase YtcJ